MDAQEEKLKTRAKELRALAARTSYEADRKALLQVAAEYERLAERQFGLIRQNHSGRRGRCAVAELLPAVQCHWR